MLFQKKAIQMDHKPLSHLLQLLEIAIGVSEDNLVKRFEWIRGSINKRPTTADMRILIYLMECALRFEAFPALFGFCESLHELHLSPLQQLEVDSRLIHAHLLQGRWEEAGKLLHYNSPEWLNQDTSILHFLYGCWLYVTESKDLARIHFSGTLEVSYPRTWALTHHYLLGKLGEEKEWSQEAFLWEKRQLYRQLSLYYHCMGETDKANEYRKKESREYIRADE